MATHKSAEKRHRQSLKKRLTNRNMKAAVRTQVKKARAAIEKKEGNAKELVKAAEKAIAKAASKQAPAVPTEHGEAMQRHINRTHNPKSSDKVMNRRGRVRHGGGPGAGRPEGK